MHTSWKLEAVRTAACVQQRYKVAATMFHACKQKTTSITHAHTHTTAILQACTHTLYDNIDVSAVTPNHIACTAGVHSSLILPQVGAHEV